jgi:hypothetical protein
MKDDEKYGGISVLLIVFLLCAIFLYVLLSGVDIDPLPLKESIDASPFEDHGFGKEEDF